jgi:hypothetical protein
MMPFLTEIHWIQALANIGISFRPIGDSENIGSRRSGRYQETWMNLLKVFGAQGILYSKHVEQLPIPDNLPSGIENPLAVSLSLAASFAGLVGCTVLDFEDGVPQFKGDTCSLRFTRYGEAQFIGKYTQVLRLPAYWNYAARDIVRASIFRDGYFLYQENKMVPMLIRECDAANKEGTRLILRDLNQLRCRFDRTSNSWEIPNSPLASAILGLLAADSLDSIRVFPVDGSLLLEAIRGITAHCSLWNSNHDDQEAQFCHSLNDNTSPDGIHLISASETQDLPLVFDRIDERTFNITQIRNVPPIFVELGWSWLARYEDYLSVNKGQTALERIFHRPEWQFQPSDDTFVLLSPLLTSARLYLSGCSTVWHEGGWDNEVRFRSCIAAQVQELDFHLTTHLKAVAAYDTCSIVRNVINGVAGEAGQGGLEGSSMVQPTASGVIWSRMRVRTLLTFRAVLSGMMVQTSLDVTPIQGMEDMTVLLG